MTTAKENVEIEFKLKSPCRDCPFKRTTPVHDGVFEDIPIMMPAIEMGVFIHSCHKTDPRSDGFNEGYKGKIQHCAGALGMLKKMGKEGIQLSFLRPKVKKALNELKDNPDVFNSTKEMVSHYCKEYKHRLSATKITD